MGYNYQENEEEMAKAKEAGREGTFYSSPIVGPSGIQSLLYQQAYENAKRQREWLTLPPHPVDPATTAYARIIFYILAFIVVCSFLHPYALFWNTAYRLALGFASIPLILLVRARFGEGQAFFRPFNAIPLALVLVALGYIISTSGLLILIPSWFHRFH